MVEQEKINFLEVVTNVEIATSTKTLINLETLYNKYGKNFNTLIITNTSVTPSKIFLDGKEVMYLNGSNAVWSFDWKDGITYSQLEIENTSAAVVIAAGLLKISIGRSGVL